MSAEGDEERQAKRARKRAKKLLNAHLDGLQRKQLKRKGYFEVCSSRGNTFRIATEFPFNVRLAGDARKSHIYFCMEAEDPTIPHADVMLSQKLLLENDEGEFLRLANMAYIPD